MVDVTFFFVILLGGALVGLVSGLVRRRGLAGTAVEVVVGDLFGILAGFAVLNFPIIATIVSALLGPEALQNPAVGGWMADLVYLSPVIGGFIGVGLVALVRRIMLGRTRDVSWGYLVGEFLKIAGYVLLIIALALIIATLALIGSFGAPDGFNPIVLLNDLVLPGLLIASGWVLTRAFRQPA